MIQGGTALNIIPDSATIAGTFRAFSKESFFSLRERIEEVIHLPSLLFTGHSHVDMISCLCRLIFRDTTFFTIDITCCNWNNITFIWVYGFYSTIDNAFIIYQLQHVISAEKFVSLDLLFPKGYCIM